MLCDDLEEWGGVGDRLERGDICILGLMHVVQEKLTQHCKAIIHQLKLNFKKYVKLLFPSQHLVSPSWHC